MSESHARRLYLNGASAEENSETLTGPETTFRIVYWDISCVAATARDMLAYGKAIWTDEVHNKVYLAFAFCFFLRRVKEREMYTRCFKLMFGMYN